MFRISRAIVRFCMLLLLLLLLLLHTPQNRCKREEKGENKDEI